MTTVRLCANPRPYLRCGFRDALLNIEKQPGIFTYVDSPARNTYLMTDKGKLASAIPTPPQSKQDHCPNGQGKDVLQKSKELRSQRPIEESAVLAEIGRVITLSLEVDQVYKGFAEEVKKLIPFDRISISITDVERGESYVKNITGFNPDDLQMGGTRPLAGSLALAAISTRSGALFQPQGVNEVVQRLPKLLPYFQAGLRSFIGVPLVFKDVVIGALNYH